MGVAENIYGHSKRLDWIESHLKVTDRILEFGCGTGYMITLPLLQRGYDVRGVDLDQQSIDYGRVLLSEAGMSPNSLSAENLSDLDERYDVIIASEVFEHLTDDELASVLAMVSNRLLEGGRLLVTVPNGYGWFEFEVYLWTKLGLGWLIERTRVYRLFERAKSALCGDAGVHPHPSTLSSSPHVQRFSLGGIQELLAHAGFRTSDATGTVMFAGPLSNMLFSGCRCVMRINKWFGRLFPAMAVAFMVVGEPKMDEAQHD